MALSELQREAKAIGKEYDALVKRAKKMVDTAIKNAEKAETKIEKMKDTDKQKAARAEAYSAGEEALQAFSDWPIGLAVPAVDDSALNDIDADELFEALTETLTPEHEDDDEEEEDTEEEETEE